MNWLQRAPLYIDDHSLAFRLYKLCANNIKSSNISLYYHIYQHPIPSPLEVCMIETAIEMNGNANTLLS